MRRRCHPHRRPFSRRHGFTYIDALLAIFIVGIASAVSFPKLAVAYQHHALRSAAATVANALSYLRQQAYTQGREISGVIDPVNQELKCQDVSSPNKPGETFSQSIGDFLSETRISAKGLAPKGSGINRIYPFSLNRHGQFLKQDGTYAPDWHLRIEHAGASAMINVRDDAISWSLEIDE